MWRDTGSFYRQGGGVRWTGFTDGVHGAAARSFLVSTSTAGGDRGNAVPRGVLGSSRSLGRRGRCRGAARGGQFGRRGRAPPRRHRGTGDDLRSRRCSSDCGACRGDVRGVSQAKREARGGQNGGVQRGGDRCSTVFFVGARGEGDDGILAQNPLPFSVTLICVLIQ